MEEIEELLASEESDGQPSLPLAGQSNGAASPDEPSGSEPEDRDAEEYDETGESAEAYSDAEPADDQSDDYVDEKETVTEAQSWSQSFKTQE
jgi:hypothetical protein